MHVPGKEVHQFVPDALSRFCENNMPPKGLAREVSSAMLLAALEPSFHIPSKIFNVISEVHNTKVGHHGLHIVRSDSKIKDDHTVHSAVPVLSSDEPSAHPYQDAPIYMRFL